MSVGVFVLGLCVLFPTFFILMILFVHKPQGFTSFDVIKKIKRLYRTEKVGHAGTLDPMATGLLIIAIGKDTKRLKEFIGLDKTYLATIDLLQDSDTRDLDYRKLHTVLEYDKVRGRVRRKPMNELNVYLRKGTTFDRINIPTKEQIQEKFVSILGYHPIPLTPFSAKKWKGKKLYEYARAGKPVFLDIEMQLIDFKIIDYSFPLLKMKFHVGSGAYIRSYAHWIGEQFGLGGILTSLERVGIGEWRM